MADNKCPEANSYFGRVKSALLCRRNDLLIMFLVFMQTVQNSWAAANVMVHSELSDGQFSRWISLDSLKFKETSLTPEAGKSPITLWQFTNKNSFFQIIFNDGYSSMVDCERVRKKDLIQHQNRKFERELQILLQGNTSQIHHEYKMPPVSEHEFNTYLTADEIPSSFKMAYENPEEFDDINAINQRDMLHYVKSARVQSISSVEDLPEQYRSLLQLKPIIERCEEYHRHMKEIVHGLESTNESQRQNATENLSRRKRAIKDLFLAPNTRWCGKGSAADSYLQLGGASRADKCCRKHDHCKMNIHALSGKFRLFNYRPYTVSHCNCDRRFRTCLKMADSSDANLVGNLFFNVVKTKCFVLKPEKYCKQYNYMKRKCEKKGIRKRAYLRDNREF